MKKIFSFLFICTILFANTLFAQEKDLKADTPRDGVFIHITESYDNPHRLLMPLKMATIMAKDKDVLIYMDIEAVKILVKGALDITHPEFESAHTYIKQLSSMGVGIHACPTCLKVAGYKSEDLMEGIIIANKDKFFDFTKGRIISLDY
jgi:predicted peroxiredoxin